MAGREFRDFEAAYRKRDMLLVLLAARDFSCNDSLLRTVLREQGYLASGAQLREDVAWLEQHQLVGTREIADLKIVTLLERGRDVAEGAELLEGVARPDPRRG